MGVAISRFRHGTALRTHEDDGPYLNAIRDPEILDWREHLPINDKDEKERRILELNMQHYNLPVKISPGLFLSDANGARNIPRLIELGITHVLNVGGSEAAWTPGEAYREAGIQYLRIDAVDEWGYLMLDEHLSESRAYIASARKKSGACLVHCAAGVNRSGVIVAAEMMLAERRTVLDVVLHCRTQRGNVFMNSNETFHEQLVALARREKLLGPSRIVPPKLKETSN